MRTVIYARMSTDKQSDTSPEDQIARCREFAGLAALLKRGVADAALGGGDQ